MLLVLDGDGIPAVIDLFSFVFKEEGGAQTIECPQLCSDSCI
jgi:hypothetical protein